MRLDLRFLEEVGTLDGQSPLQSVKFWLIKMEFGIASRGSFIIERETYLVL